MNTSTVYSLIECRRSELNTLANIYGIKDHRVLTKSVQLDDILNEYLSKKVSRELKNHSQIKS
ncbi:aspartyl-phosphate phosphatase Spo0E family protein [Paenibacillus glacialis]|uniref:aspartyl-phosphate phosphatase Spo0E family protein n=1 Tax=Paenibacillus glacialis TaxID=494026 RepID=UPI000AC348C6|nr:aspartyl-phosphate phosphatase Spo0E family protein [Paenibacillus glacialis]